MKKNDKKADKWQIKNKVVKGIHTGQKETSYQAMKRCKGNLYIAKWKKSI